MNDNLQPDSDRDAWGFQTDAPVSGEDWVTDPRTGIRYKRMEFMESGAVTIDFLGRCLGTAGRPESQNS